MLISSQFRFRQQLLHLCVNRPPVTLHGNAIRGRSRAMAQSKLFLLPANLWALYDTRNFLKRLFWSRLQTRAMKYNWNITGMIYESTRWSIIGLSPPPSTPPRPPPLNFSYFLIGFRFFVRLRCKRALSELKQMPIAYNITKMLISDVSGVVYRIIDLWVYQSK